MRLSELKDGIFFVGLGGTGMAPLAELCLKRNRRVLGSDISYNQAIKELEKGGAVYFPTHQAKNIDKAACLIYSSAIAQDNPELLEAKKRKIPVLHRSEFLKIFMEEKKSICVAGTHGKTTSAAMLIHVLKDLGQKPDGAVGGRMLANNRYAISEGGEFFIAEADESDGSLTSFHSFGAVLTNIDLDHIDVHGGLLGLQELFSKFLSQINEEGFCALGWDYPACRELFPKINVDCLSYGKLLGCDVRLLSYRLEGSSIIAEAIVEKDRLKFRLPQIGVHNVINALSTLTVTRLLGLNINSAAESLEGFSGVARRMALSYSQKEFFVFDDYAHNPGKIHAALSAIKEAFPTHERHVIFQPHRFSRLRSLYQDFCTSFVNSGCVVHLLPTFAAGESDPGDLGSEKLAEDIEAHSQVRVICHHSLQACADSLLTLSEKRCVVLSLGAGDVWQVGRLVRKALS